MPSHGVLKKAGVFFSCEDGHGNDEELTQEKLLMKTDSCNGELSGQ